VETQVAALVAVALLALLHASLGHRALRVLDRVPRSKWLSFGGGVASAFVLVDLLPAVAHAQRLLEETGQALLPEADAYVVALAGLVLVLAAEHATQRRRPRRHQDAGARSAAQPPSADVPFALTLVTYALLNALVGHILTARHLPLASLAAFAAAVAMKFLVNDHALAEDHAGPYRRFGRPLVLGSFLLGAALGAGWPLPELGLLLAQAFLAGAILLAMLKEELPSRREGRGWPFAVGAAAYTALLLAAAALDA